MPKMVPRSKNGAAERLIELFMRTERKLLREIARKRMAGLVDYSEYAALLRVRGDLQRMLDESAKLAPLAVEHEFHRGYKKAEALINIGRTLAIEQLTDNLVMQVQEMANTAYQGTAAKIMLGRPDQDIFRETGIQKALEAMAEGRGALTKTQEFVKELEQSGVTAFVDKAGREWSLSSYGNMAVRTTVRQAQVSAILTEDEHDLYRIIQHFAPCRLCGVYSGRVYSKSGTNPNYPPLSMAFGKIDPGGGDDLSNTFLNIHPNCLCTIARYTEKGKTEKQIQAMRERSSFEKHPADIDERSKMEIEAYRTKERKRARLRADMKQFDRYTQNGVPGMPKNFETFQKHKALNDDKYKAWVSAYRGAGS